MSADVRECCFIVPKCNYFGVFVQIRLLSTGPEPAAVCPGMSSAKPTGLAGCSYPTGELIWVAGEIMVQEGIPWFQALIKNVSLWIHLWSLSRQVPVGKATERKWMCNDYSIWQFCTLRPLYTVWFCANPDKSWQPWEKCGQISILRHVYRQPS